LKQIRLELEDEKKKNEDLQFKVEENEIMASGDGDQSSQISEELQEKIKNLESQLQKSKSNLIDNQTEFQTKIKILESELEVQKKASSNHQSIVEQLNGITLELETERNEKEETKNQLLSKNKEVDLNSTKMFEGTYIPQIYISMTYMRPHSSVWAAKGNKEKKWI
jgi:hypothetical protein